VVRANSNHQLDISEEVHALPLNASENLSPAVRHRLGDHGMKNPSELVAAAVGVRQHETVPSSRTSHIACRVYGAAYVCVCAAIPIDVVSSLVTRLMEENSVRHTHTCATPPGWSAPGHRKDETLEVSLPIKLHLSALMGSLSSLRLRNFLLSPQTQLGSGTAPIYISLIAFEVRLWSVTTAAVLCGVYARPRGGALAGMR
jgi:hypothetical protein